MGALRRSIWRSCVLVCLLASAGGPAHATPPPVEDYMRWPFVDQLALSPSGTRLALAIPTVDGRVQLAVMGLSPVTPPKAVTGIDDADVFSPQWVNDSRIVFFASDRTAPAAKAGAAAFAVNADGSGFQRLYMGGWLRSTLDDGTADIIVATPHGGSIFEPPWVALSRFDTDSHRASRSLVLGAPPGAFAWLLDAQAKPRAVLAEKEGRASLYWREQGDPAWAPVAQFDAYGTAGFKPLALDGEDHLLVSAALGRDTEALYRFDTKTRKVDPEPLVALEGFDLDPVLETDSATREVVGLHFRTDRPHSYWFDASLRAVQRGVDAALPAGRFNHLWCGRCKSTPFLVVESTSDTQPGEFYLYDRRTSSLERIASRRPWIDESRQGRRSFHRIAARDGLPLPVYLTHPPGAPKEPLPAVVLVHGGPWLRGHDLTWDAEAQFLASRGYLVIQVEFRGSTGYGVRHFRAGFKQLGRAMQDDLADAVRWAVKEGWADAKRIAIVGASYGGYAALMGPIRDPGLYRAAVSFAGVTDFDLMYDIWWSDASDEYKRYGMPMMIGDQKADASLLAAASPLRRVAEIKVPVLLAHGGRDRRVPIEHSREFRDAAERAGVKVEWVEYADEGHGLYSPANRADYWKRVEAFLARHLGAPATP